MTERLNTTRIPGGRGAPRGALRMVLGVALVAGLLAACGGGEDEAGDGSTGAGSTEAEPGGGDDVVLVTYDAFALPEEAAAAFEQSSGVGIEVVAGGDSGAVLSAALLSAGSPDGDVIFGIDDATATRVLTEDLLEPVDPEGLERVDPSLKLPGELGEVLVPIDTGDVCVNADASWFADKGLAPPETLEDLADPRYAGLLAVQSPVGSSPGLAFLVGTEATFGEQWPAYWERLRANDVRVAPSWDDAYYNDYTVNGGERPLVVSYASSPPAEVVFSEGSRTEPASVVLEGTCVRQVEYAGVLRGAAHPEQARELLAFMLSDAWQSELPLTNFVYPATDVALPEEFTRWAPRPPAPIVVDPVEVGEQREEWIEQWRAVME